MNNVKIYFLKNFINEIQKNENILNNVYNLQNMK